MNKPIVTVVMPVYNAALYLEQMLSSIADQTFRDFEVLIVNDGSTDDSAEIIGRWLAVDDRFKVIVSENVGPGAARNMGLTQASGEWIYFADADDWLHPDALREWHSVASKSEADFVLVNAFEFVDEIAEGLPALFNKQQWNCSLPGAEWIVHAVNAGEWPHYCWLQFTRLSFIRKYKLAFPVGTLHEDVIWTTNLALAASRVMLLNSPLYGYRKTPQSIMNSSSEKVIARRITGYLHIITYFLLLAQASEGSLKAALHLHANRETGHMLGLFRKRIHTPELRQQLAQEALRRIPFNILLRHARGFPEVYRVVRTWLNLKRFVA